VTADKARARWLGIAAAVGLACSAWAAFQWYELLVARRGGTIVCLGGGGHCAEVWDSPFASAVHARTGLPVAAWGVVFGLAAFALPLVARLRLARRRAADSWLAAIWVVAVAGLVGVVVLVTASLRFGHLCTTCGLTYLLTSSYAGVVFAGVRLAPPPGLVRGASLALAAVALGFGVLLFPGLRTPQSLANAGAQAVGESAPLATYGTDDAELAGFIAKLAPPVRQLLSDTLAAYAASPVIEPPPARTKIGPDDARLHIVEFFDTLCSHCAQLHETLVQLRQRFGPDAFQLSPHQFPLDPGCNPTVVRPDSDPLHCIAARAHICAEGRPGAFDLAAELFEKQRALTEPIILEAAEKVVPADALAACMASPDTAAKLSADVAWAAGQNVRGTPFLLIENRKALPFPPLLYVLALTRGASSHPAFAALPPAQPLPEALR
jgi:serine/threonine-protein kinase